MCFFRSSVGNCWCPSYFFILNLCGNGVRASLCASFSLCFFYPSEFTDHAKGSITCLITGFIILLSSWLPGPPWNLTWDTHEQSNQEKLDVKPKLLNYFLVKILWLQPRSLVTKIYKYHVIQNSHFRNNTGTLFHTEAPLTCVAGAYYRK